MSEYRLSFMQKLKMKWHIWRAERLLRKGTKMMVNYQKVFSEMRRHTRRARELLEESRL